MRSRYSYIYIIGARHRDEALEKKTSPKIWWIQKVVVPLHSQLQRKGGRKCPIHDWRSVTTMADRSACRADLLARSRDWSEALRRLLFNTSFRQIEIDRRKKTSPNIWWFQKLVVPLHSQPERKSSSLFTG